jgi:hypothetical protein
VNIDVTGLAGMDHARNGLAVLVLHIYQYRRAYSIEIPHIMRNVLGVADVFAGIEINGHQGVGVEIVAGAQ